MRDDHPCDQPLLTGSILTPLVQVRQKPPAGRSSRQQPAGSSCGSGGGSSSNSVSGGGGSSGASSSSSSARASPAGTIRAPTGHHGRPPLASNFSLDDITAQLEKVTFIVNINVCEGHMDIHFQYMYCISWCFYSISLILKKKKLMSFKNTDFSFVTYQTEKCCDVCLRGALWGRGKHFKLWVNLSEQSALH